MKEKYIVVPVVLKSNYVNMKVQLFGVISTLEYKDEKYLSIVFKIIISLSSVLG